MQITQLKPYPSLIAAVLNYHNESINVSSINVSSTLDDEDLFGTKPENQSQNQLMYKLYEYYY